MSEPTGVHPPVPPGATTPGVPTAAPPQKPQRLALWIVLGVVGLLVVVGVAVVVGILAARLISEVSSDLGSAEVGDCLDDQPDVNDIRVVDCASQDADLEVVSVNEGITENEFDRAPFEELCPSATDPNAGAIWYGEGVPGGNGAGDVYCVSPISP